MSNIVKDDSWNYGFYAKEEGLAEDLNEHGYTKLDRQTFDYTGSILYFCNNTIH